MSLFRIREVKNQIYEKSLSPQGLKSSGISIHLIGRSLTELSNAIGELQHDQIIQYSTGGRWSMHEMLQYILIKTGPSKVWLTTWTITEDPMRALLDLIQKGYITELNAVLDYRIEKRKPEAFQLASNLITRIKLTKCHAKVLVIKNDTWNVAIVTTANFSKNPRIEAGVIFTDKTSANFHSEWIDDVIDGKEVFRVR